MVEGGGSTEHPGVKVYLLLAVKDIDGPEVRKVTERFKRTAKYTKKDIGGEIVDLNTDHRMREKLVATDAGKSLYEKLSASAPVICISTKHIGDPGNTEEVELLRFADYEQNPERMFAIIDSKMTTDKERKGFIEWLTLLNEVVVLRPSIFGLGFDLNKVIGKYLAKRP